MNFHTEVCECKITTTTYRNTKSYLVEKLKKDLRFNILFFFTQERYHGNFTGVCLKMRCYDPKRDGCYWRDGGDGMSCGDGKVIDTKCKKSV